ncbi:HD domain-containing phosphohydrolase [Dermatophilus congolensis]|uniref:HD domain-containing protein n=1 Tax=Dermatophilus congolensis TaxID=1863 RepID=A0A239VNZ3_9MICO|nr:HD domain-containing phosphohydrolase [Dermatophilus congolensis]MBO3129655.1 hypothetical protein [Dermatophilus congolensis]MBO3131713.1 hypothetical protein [Dermatophilus congolensis]MBO3134129.1 hypothetical protein [Dermatophilus congolensis]MBO3136362.1 hypothetical protein [Dermatophilus congolensis]MBO3138610.1 hypothetical protein [Dermatophilus congolensis]
MTIPGILAYLAVLTIAEAFRLRIRGRFETAPTAHAVGLALAVSVTTPQGPIQLTATHIAALVLISQLLAIPFLWVTRARGERHELLADSALRLFTVTAVAILVRELPLLHGNHVVDMTLTWPGWRRAIVLMSAIGFILSIEAPFRVWLYHRLMRVDALNSHTSDARIPLALSVVVVASSASLALAQEAIGLAALPLGLVPLVATQIAVLHQARVHRAQRQSVRALSKLPEIAGLLPRGHGTSVARLSVAIAQEMGLTAREISHLETAALLHDLGQVVLRRPIPSGATVLAAPADQEHLAATGASIVDHIGRLNAVTDTLAAQAVPYYQLVQNRARIPQTSRVLKVANAYVDYVGGTLADADNDAHNEAMERIYLGLGYEYDPKAVAALETVLDRSGYGTQPINHSNTHTPTNTEPKHPSKIRGVTRARRGRAPHARRHSHTDHDHVATGNGAAHRD